MGVSDPVSVGYTIYGYTNKPFTLETLLLEVTNQVMVIITNRLPHLRVICYDGCYIEYSRVDYV